MKTYEVEAYPQQDKITFSLTKEDDFELGQPIGAYSNNNRTLQDDKGFDFGISDVTFKVANEFSNDDDDVVIAVKLFHTKKAKEYKSTCEKLAKTNFFVVEVPFANLGADCFGVTGHWEDLGDSGLFALSTDYTYLKVAIFTEKKNDSKKASIVVLESHSYI